MASDSRQHYESFVTHDSPSRETASNYPDCEYQFNVRLVAAFIKVTPRHDAIDTFWKQYVSDSIPGSGTPFVSNLWATQNANIHGSVTALGTMAFGGKKCGFDGFKV
uniref:ALOG domain-containing protein n=1 Tax=Panagrellus redivivus TaxID=6233 RepID=A0A7E4VY84_PANRE